MGDFIYKISQNIVLGSYTISRISQYVKNFGNRFMIIMDPVLKEVNLEQKILQPLVERKIDYFVFENITEGANSKQIEQAISLAQNGHVNGIIAVGGEKAMNAGAAVASLVNENHNIYDYLEGANPTTASLPLICIPTTMRAPFVFGSTIPVIDSRSRQVKLLKTQNGICKQVLWDPNLTLTLTENQKASISIETLCLATEAYLSQKASFFSDMFSEKAVELLKMGMDGSSSLEVITPQEVLLAQGGCLASIAAATSSIGITSLLALTINSRYRISRALVTSILFPYVLEEVKNYKADKIVKIAQKMGSNCQGLNNEEISDSFADSIRQRLAKANLPTRLKDLSITIDQLALVAEDAGQLDVMNCLPRSMTPDELFDLLKQAY